MPYFESLKDIDPEASLHIMLVIEFSKILHGLDRTSIITHQSGMEQMGCKVLVSNEVIFDVTALANN